MPLPNEPTVLVTLAIELSRGAGDILRTFSQHARSMIDTKSSNVDLVTDADKASERFLVDALRARRPDDAIVSEEGSNYSGTSGVEWIIDPLDGTTNFVYSVPFYAVSVGVAVNGQPVAGAVYNPILDEMYSAHIGGGAFCNSEPIHANPVKSLDRSLIATGFSYSSETRGKQAAITARLMPEVRDIRRLGAAALDLCNVACGRVDAYFEHDVKPWDVTAGYVIATEAGAKVTSLDGGIPKTNVIAAPIDLYEQLLPHLT